MLSGARGYLTKSCRQTLLARAIRSAFDGGMTLEAGLVPEYLRTLSSSVESGDHSLSPRERQVLTLISKGYSNKLISVEMNLAESTVKKYVYTLMSKLGASDRAHSAALGIKLGLIR
jgi:DNA-binding NarL/FixJ family response regulator